MNKLLAVLIVLTLLGPVTGELFKITFLNFDLLPADVLIPIFFVVWAADKIHRDRQIRLGRVGKTIILFLLIVLVMIILNAFRYDLREVIAGGIYFARFAMYILLASVVYDLLRRDPKRIFLKAVLGGMAASMVLIAVLGFLQLKYFPNFLELGLYASGWDPHIGRLTSTWLDPNFIGGYLAFILGPAVAIGLYFRHHKQRKWFYVMTAFTLLGLVALYYTYSRSGYLALIATLGVLAFFKSRKLLIATALICLLAVAFSPRVQERALEAWDSGKAVIGLDSQRAVDPTAQLRVWSWSFAREIIVGHPLIGIGYGRYKYEIVNRGHGLMSDHSVSGSDSSLLTIWAMTGIFGFLGALLIGAAAGVQAIKKIRKKDFYGYLAAGLLASFCGVFVHSIFVNSLLYALMMVYLWVGLGLLDAVTHESP